MTQTELWTISEKKKSGIIIQTCSHEGFLSKNQQLLNFCFDGYPYLFFR